MAELAGDVHRIKPKLDNQHRREPVPEAVERDASPSPTRLLEELDRAQAELNEFHAEFKAKIDSLLARLRELRERAES